MTTASNSLETALDLQRGEIRTAKLELHGVSKLELLVTAQYSAGFAAEVKDEIGNLSPFGLATATLIIACSELSANERRQLEGAGWRLEGNGGAWKTVRLGTQKNVLPDILLLATARGLGTAGAGDLGPNRKTSTEGISQTQESDEKPSGEAEQPVAGLSQSFHVGDIVEFWTRNAVPKRRNGEILGVCSSQGWAARRHWY
jgi:hypothetical protein